MKLLKKKFEEAKMVYINKTTRVFSAQGVLRRPAKRYNLSD